MEFGLKRDVERSEHSNTVMRDTSCVKCCHIERTPTSYKEKLHTYDHDKCRSQ